MKENDRRKKKRKETRVQEKISNSCEHCSGFHFTNLFDSKIERFKMKEDFHFEQRVFSL